MNNQTFEVKYNDIDKIYSCNTCNYKNKKKYNVERHIKLIHINRPLIPEPEIDSRHVCDKCNKSYATKWYLTKHKKSCVGLINKKECTYCNKTLASVQSKKRHMAICKYKIMPFNNENTDYITSEFALKCLQSNIFGVYKMINHIYFNDDHEENYNIKLVNLTSKSVKIFTNKLQWEYDNLNNIIYTMISNAARIIIDKSDTLKSSDIENIINVNLVLNPKLNEKKMIMENIKSKLAFKYDIDL